MKHKLRKVSNIVLIAAVAAVIGYAITAIVAHFVTGIELSPTLTTAWFSFWGVEIIALATIKNTKTRHGGQPPESEDEDEDIYE